ncbi:MAG: class I poly(R)-hydroxyalkanoic acid synthase [Beijerinckiaceae bacterium]
MAGRKSRHGGKGAQRLAGSRRASTQAASHEGAHQEGKKRSAGIGDIRREPVPRKKLTPAAPAANPAAKPQGRRSRQGPRKSAFAPELDKKVEAAPDAAPRLSGAQRKTAPEPRPAKDLHAGKAEEPRRAPSGAAPEQAEPAAAHLDVEALAANLSRLAEEAARATQAYLRPQLAGESSSLANAELGEIARTLGEVAERWMGEPQRALEAQTRLTSGLIGLWTDTLRRFEGEDVPPAQPPDPADRRFKDPAWTQNPFFDFLRQSYVHTAKWAEDMVHEAKDIDPHTRHKAQFYVRQLAAALSPTNFVALNPELIRATIEQNGANLVRGVQMLAEDVEAGGGELKLRQTDAGTFEVGVNLATTPGKVVLRNDLIELIQYAPSTERVLRRPLLIVPPWINKFYILDLNPEKSFIRWAVAQGLTVFVISWVNPDARHAAKSFDAYMKEGTLAAIAAIEQATGEKKVSAIGYCVGGTLLSTTLGYMAAKGDRRIESATLLATQVDFKHSGDLQVFVDEKQVSAVEDEMRLRGFLDGKRMAMAFNMLRPNDLIWRYMVDVYLKGKSPMAFDLLFWNSDSTRMPAANHSFYLRNCYLENNLTKGRMVIDGVTIDLGRVTIPIYNLAAKEDHIAPALSTFEGSRHFGGEVRYVLAGSGHIAGVINPPAHQKYQYWTGGPVGDSFQGWVERAEEHKGSWWPDWFAWLERQAPEHVVARVPGGGKLTPLEDAPGTYVKVKA